MIITGIEVSVFSRTNNNLKQYHGRMLFGSVGQNVSLSFFSYFNSTSSPTVYGSSNSTFGKTWNASQINTFYVQFDHRPASSLGFDSK